MPSDSKTNIDKGHGAKYDQIRNQNVDEALPGMDRNNSMNAYP